MRPVSLVFRHTVGRNKSSDGGKAQKMLQPSELFDASPNQSGTLDRMSAEHLASYRRRPRLPPAICITKARCCMLTCLVAEPEQTRHKQYRMKDVIRG